MKQSRAHHSDHLSTIISNFWISPWKTRPLTLELADVNVEGKFLVLEVEHLVVLVLIIHEVDARADVGTRLELQAQLVARSLDTISAGVVSAIHGTVGSAGDSIGAESSVPGVAGVAVGRARGGVEPAPVTVKDDTLRLRSTAAGGAGRYGEGGVPLRSKSTSLLSVDCRTQREGGEGEREGRHACRLVGESTDGLAGDGRLVGGDKGPLYDSPA